MALRQSARECAGAASPRSLQLGDLHRVVDLIPTLDDQVTGLGIHGVELTAGVAATKDLIVASTARERVSEAGDGGIAGTG